MLDWFIKIGNWFIVVMICSLAVIGGGILAVVENGWYGLVLPVLLIVILIGTIVACKKD